MSATIDALSHATGGLWPYLVVIFVGFLPSEIWRWLSVFLVKGLSEDSEILIWVRAVASALLAGVVAKLLLSPSGALAAVPAAMRWGAIAAGLAVFFASRRSVMAGVITGEAIVIGGGFWATT
jgi:hypothetical protein